MTDIHDIRDPIDATLIDIKIVIIVVFLFITTLFLFITFILYKRFKTKRRVKIEKINHKKEAINKLNNLKKLIKKEKDISLDEAYFQVSAITRWYIGGVRMINGLSKTRHEVYVALTKCFDELLWKCYLVEFAGSKSTKDDTLKTIDLAIKLVNKCN